MPSSITRMTSLDHERIGRLVRRACTMGPSQSRWRDELVTLVRAHRTAEAAVLTPEVLQAGGLEVASGVDALRRVDQALNEAVDIVARAPLPSPELTDAGRTLQQLLSVHAEILGTQVLRPLEQAVPRKEIRRLGGAYGQRRDEAMHQEGAAAELPRRFDLPRAELYELARRAGIEGRSAMSRRDLIIELQRRQGTG